MARALAFAAARPLGNLALIAAIRVRGTLLGRRFAQPADQCWSLRYRSAQETLRLSDGLSSKSRANDTGVGRNGHPTG